MPLMFGLDDSLAVTPHAKLPSAAERRHGGAGAEGRLCGAGRGIWWGRLSSATALPTLRTITLRMAALFRRSSSCAPSVLTLYIQRAILRIMSKARASSSDRSRGETTAVAARSSVADARGSINLRIEANTRQLIDDAAAILGKTRTEFMIESARRQAIDVLLDQRLFVLDPKRFDAFMQMLDNPPAPGPKLRSLLRRVPAWRK